MPDLLTGPVLPSRPDYLDVGRQCACETCRITISLGSRWSGGVATSTVLPACGDARLSLRPPGRLHDHLTGDRRHHGAIWFESDYYWPAYSRLPQLGRAAMRQHDRAAGSMAPQPGNCSKLLQLATPQLIERPSCPPCRGHCHRATCEWVWVCLRCRAQCSLPSDVPDFVH